MHDIKSGSYSRLCSGRSGIEIINIANKLSSSFLSKTELLPDSIKMRKGSMVTYEHLFISDIVIVGHCVYRGYIMGYYITFGVIYWKRTVIKQEGYEQP